MGSETASTNFRIRIVLTVSGVIQSDSYAFVVLWSLVFGQVNLALPIIVSFFATALILLILIAGEILQSVIGLRRKFPINGTKLYISLSGPIPLILVAVYGGMAIVIASAPVNFEVFDPAVRW